MQALGVATISRTPVADRFLFARTTRALVAPPPPSGVILFSATSSTCSTRCTVPSRSQFLPHHCFSTAASADATTFASSSSTSSAGEQLPQQNLPNNLVTPSSFSFRSTLSKRDPVPALENKRNKAGPPFYVKRTSSGNLPIYVFKKNNKTLALTVIRKVRGDINELKKQLEVLCRTRVRISESQGLEIFGDCKNVIRSYLEGCGS
ncbi:unnamed protein product [Amoebophrya sp. A120]|nr:unnamed protein product [Amoebophrya sp. A120]|eukprot:GSA120T00010577001.1